MFASCDPGDATLFFAPEPRFMMLSWPELTPAQRPAGQKAFGSESLLAAILPYWLAPASTERDFVSGTVILQHRRIGHISAARCSKSLTG